MKGVEIIKRYHRLDPAWAIRMCLGWAACACSGEVNLIGRKNEPMLQFDLDLGMRVDVEKKVASWTSSEDVASDAGASLCNAGPSSSIPQPNAKVGRPKNDETDYWPGIVQIVHFATKLKDLHRVQIGFCVLKTLVLVCFGFHA